MEVRADAADGRVRRVTLTEAAQTEREELDRRSDEGAQAVLESLSGEEQARLVEAMARVERLILRARTTVALAPAGSAEVRYCFGRYYEELDRRFESGFDVGRSNPADVADLTPPSGFVLLAWIGLDPLYRGAGYREVPAFNEEPYAHHWFEKSLGPSPTSE